MPGMVSFIFDVPAGWLFRHADPSRCADIASRSAFQVSGIADAIVQRNQRCLTSHPKEGASDPDNHSLTRRSRDVGHRGGPQFKGW